MNSLAISLADRYRIERELGAGGMATVYLAEDHKHHRRVALKVLRPELAAILGAERFLNEITVTANLQHPNILPLYDSGEAGTFLYYVMPYVEGESLRQKLNRERQLSVEQAVTIATAVAGALQYAHEQGIIHRDIKPENILLTRGQPLVADFGIALAISRAGGTRLTETGLSLGTPHYMSPEQAAGDRDLDARSDLYSLGAVVYEMLVGEPPHVGNSVQAIIARILSDTPAPITRSRQLVPPNVDAAVQRALAKSPADRFTGAAQFGEALKNPAFRLPSAPAVSERRARGRAVAVLGGLLAVTAATALWGWLRTAATGAGSTAGIRRLTITLPDSLPLAVGTGRPAIAVTPDGARLVYVARAHGQHRLMLMDLTTGGLTPVPGGTGATGPVLSSSTALFFVRTALLAAPLAGGRTQRVSTVTPVTRGAAWLSESSAVVVPSPNSGVIEARFFANLAQASSRGSLTWLTPMGESRAWPDVLPGGRGMLFATPVGDDPDGWRIAAQSLSGDGERNVVDGGSNPRYAASGHIVFVRRAALWAVPFDADRLEVRGGPVLVQPGILTEPDGVAHFAMSREGTLVYAPGEDWQTSRRLVWASPDGALEPLPITAGAYTELALAPDGRRVAITRADGSNYDVWVGDLSRGSLIAETRHPGEDGSPVWDPHGSRLAIATEQWGDPPKLGLRELSRGGGFQPVGDTGLMFSAPTGWSADGRLLFFVSNSTGIGQTPSGSDLSVLDVRAGQRSLWLQTPNDERSAVPSLDGRWVAYVSNESGRDEVYLRSMTGTAARIPVSTGGGVEPRWGRLGRSLYYRQDDRILAVTVAGAGASPTLSSPQIAFRLPSTLYLTGGFNAAAWDLAADERRILALEELSQVQVTTLRVVLNWFEELKDKVRPQ